MLILAEHHKENCHRWRNVFAEVMSYITGGHVCEGNVQWLVWQYDIKNYITRSSCWSGGVSYKIYITSSHVCRGNVLLFGGAS